MRAETNKNEKRSRRVVRRPQIRTGRGVGAVVTITPPFCRRIPPGPSRAIAGTSAEPERTDRPILESARGSAQREGTFVLIPPDGDPEGLPV